MAYTMQNVVDKALKPLNDASKTRWTDDDLLAYANDAVRVLRRERPDLFFGQYTSLPGDKTLAQDLPVDDEYMTVVADYVTARAETIDDEEALAARAALFFQLFQGAKNG